MKYVYGCQWKMWYLGLGYDFNTKIGTINLGPLWLVFDLKDEKPWSWSRS